MKTPTFAIAACILSMCMSAPASATYWNVFSDVTGHALPTNFVTYATLDDMMHDINRLNVVETTGGGVQFDKNIVDSGSDGSTYWSVFADVTDHTLTDNFVTYGTLDDMMHDTNRLNVVETTGGGVQFDRNITGSGYDGHVYWNVFSDVTNHTLPANFVTYATLDDMMHDTNRLNVLETTGGGVQFDKNILDGGSNGTTYWNIFSDVTNHTLTDNFVTYANLDDMENDTNRLSVIETTGGGIQFDRNITGSGTDDFAGLGSTVPEPSTWVDLMLGFVGVGIMLRDRRITTRDVTVRQ